MTYLGEGEHDIAPDVYHADPCETPALSAGLAAILIEGTPAHAWNASPRLNPDYEQKTSDAFDFGSAAHEVILGKGQGIYVIDADSYRSQAARDERDGARADGYIPLLAKQVERVEQMARAVFVQLKQRGLYNSFDRALPERTLIWEAGGVWNRCMVDKLDHEGKIAWDLKTCAGYADPDVWVNRDMGHGVDVRKAHYLDGLTRLFGPGWTYRFLVAEKVPPFLIAPPIELTEGAIHLGREKLAIARDRWRRCLADNDWPGWPEGIAVVEPRIFHESKWEERKARDKASPEALKASYELQAP